MIVSLEDCIKFVFGVEGSPTDDPDDPGGFTKYGIAQNFHPEADVRNLTIEQAAQIYKVEYWDAVRAEDFPPHLRLALFDTAVNCGPKIAIQLLQSALKVKVDGVVGPKTLEAANSSPRALRDLLAKRIIYYTDRPHFDKYAYGWIRRVLDVYVA